MAPAQYPDDLAEPARSHCNGEERFASRSYVQGAAKSVRFRAYTENALMAGCHTAGSGSDTDPVSLHRA